MGAFEVSRSTFIDASPARVAAHLTDFRRWQEWSPWEGLDPGLRRTYSDPSGGEGATYSWEGNRKAGAGSMEMTSVAEDRIEITLRLLKPFRSENQVAFDLQSVDGGTRATWRMTGRTTGVMGLLSRLWPMDKLVGRDFERGLGELKHVAESEL